jgi:hypothetical protein
MGKVRGRSRLGQSSLETVRLVQPLLAGLRQHDAALTEQLVRALTSLAISAGAVVLAEQGRKREHVLAAVASASEAGALLRMAVDWRYCTWLSAKAAYEELNRTAFMLWRLARVKKPRPKALRRAS